jgi:cytolysin-activating lysine-acyltransferase
MWVNVNATDSPGSGLDPNFVKSLGPAQIGAALSKLFAASIGDVVVVFSRSPAHKHYSLADIEWTVLPPVSAGQFYVVEAADKERGFRAPIAVVTWALVSEEVDARLRQEGGQRLRLRPDQWKCGEIAWIIDAVGREQGLDAALQWLKRGQFKDRPLHLVTRDQHGSAVVSTLERLIAERSEGARAHDPSGDIGGVE